MKILAIYWNSPEITGKNIFIHIFNVIFELIKALWLIQSLIKSMTETDMESTTKIETEFYLYRINYELAFVFVDRWLI